MAESIRGHGLELLHRALDPLANNPELLERMRSRRWSHSTPMYIYSLSGTATASQASETMTEEERLREKKKYQLIEERRASYPSEQFDQQVREEMRRIARQSTLDMGITFRDDQLPMADWDTIKRAMENVKKCWVEQGIWNERWKEMNQREQDIPCGLWKHEEPLEIESESEGNDPPSPPKTGEEKPRRPKSAEELRLIQARRVRREREREASRPFYQFIYQVSQQRERIQGESGSEEATATSSKVSPEINTRAYEVVKKIWMDRGIWNRKWGVMPGMSWKHEQPIDEMLAEEMGLDPALQERPLAEENNNPRLKESTPNPADAGSGERAFEAVSPSGFSRSPVSFRSYKIHSSSPISNPPSPPTRRRQCTRSPVSQKPRQERTVRLPNDGRDRQAPDTTLRPVRPMKVSKASSGWKRGLSRRGGKVSELLSSNMPQPNPVDLEPPSPPPVTSAAPAPLRRSKRLQEKKEKTAAAPNPTVADNSADSLPRASTPKPKERRLKPSSASEKPSGLSKRPHQNTRRRGQR